MKNIALFARKYRKQVIIAGSVLGFVLTVAVFYAIIAAVIPDDEPPIQQNSNSSTTTSSSATGSGSGLHGSIRKLVRSVSSTRNLKGLTLRINQIDTCSLPKATAYIGVSGADGNILSQLNKSDVTVTVDGKKISNFSFDPATKNQRSIASTVVLDHSGSMRGAAIEQAKAAASTFINNSSDQDSFSVIQFDSNVDVLQGRTKDKSAVNSAINSIQVRGDTAIYDALATAVDNTAGCDRKAIVLLSDGEDTASKSANLESAINKANLAGLPVFTVGLKSEGYTPTVLQSIANRTGGQYYEANNPADLTSLYQKIDAQLKGQYYIGLKFDIKKTSKQHSLKITSNVEGSPTSSERFFIY